MKLRRMVSILAAIAMTGSMVAVATAAGPAPIVVPAKATNYEEVPICGGDVEPETDSINVKIVGKVKFTLSTEGDVTCVDEEGNTCASGECVGVAVNTHVKTGGFNEEKFCIAKQKEYTFDLTAAGFPKLKNDDDPTSDAIDFLKVAAANWGLLEANGGAGAALTAKVEIIGTDGSVLALGQQELASAATPATTTASTAKAPAGTAAQGGSAPKSGAVDALALGGVAVVALGAVVLSRKRK